MNLKMKLGKLAPRHDPRTLRMETYVDDSKLPPIPASIDWGTKVLAWQMLMNDTLGDCTCAGAGHLIMDWSSNAGTLVTPTDSQILTAYEQITGYTPTDPNTDQGAVELDVLRYWKNTGIAGHKISSYIQVNPKNLLHVRAAIALFGGIYTGVQMPASAMDATQSGLPWSNADDTNIEGGHAIPLIAYDASTFTCITWGQPQLITTEWWLKYADEAYCILSPDFISATGQAPSGFDADALQADLLRVRS